MIFLLASASAIQKLGVARTLMLACDIVALGSSFFNKKNRNYGEPPRSQAFQRVRMVRI